MSMRRPVRPNAVIGGAFFSLAALCAGCSILFHADAKQCSSTGDCLARGAAFANHVCQAGTCVFALPPVSDGGGGNDAAREAEASAPRPDASEDGGMADASMEAETSVGCTSNADCPVLTQNHPEVACDVISHSCLQLTTDECPYVIGDISGADAAPIYIGAFATLPPGAPNGHPSYLNYKLAIDEFTAIHGIPGYDPVRQNGLRMPVAVICNADADVHAAMVHLTTDIHVPAVIAAMSSGTLRTMFVNDAYPNTFVINPFGADSTLTNGFATDGLLWHMLGQPSDMAPTYAGFLPRYEAYVRTLQGLTAPTRVAVVTANATVTADLSDAALKVMRWNDMSVIENNNAGNFRALALESVLNGKDLGTIDVSTAVSSLLSFKPNIIVSFASAEFVKMLQVLELQWQTSGTNPNPAYLVGPYNMGSQDLPLWIGNSAGGNPNTPQELRRKRVAGVGVASASDTHVLDSYSIRFLAAYGASAQSALGQENYYDAMYFAVYSLVGAGTRSIIRGQNMAEGMQRLLSGTSYDMGPGGVMGNIFGALGSSSGTISLFGTLGPPTFTRSTGARIGEGSVYCISRNVEAGTASYAYDVMRVVSPAPDGGVPGLGGIFPCYSGI